MIDAWRHFDSVWCVLAIVERRPGEPLRPLLIAAHDPASGAVLQFGQPRLQSVRRPPYPTAGRSLIVTVAGADLAGVHLALGWRLPDRLIDLLVEQHNSRPGRFLPVGGLAGAFVAAGLPAADGMVSAVTPAAIDRRLRALARLLARVMPVLDIGRALLRGRYLVAVARMEAAGVPVDVALTARLGAVWPMARRRIAARLAPDVFPCGRFDDRAFAHWLRAQPFAWPRSSSGALDLADAAFREMARLYPAVARLTAARSLLAGFDPAAIALGRDGRNRVPLRPFASVTGRNQPPARSWILAQPSWARRLMRPAPGTAVALIDWQQQEFAIAAALSGDVAMWAAYASGDPYVAFARAAGVPEPSAAVRERYKVTALGVQYGLGRARLARMLGVPESVAATLIADHRRRYPRFWSWLDVTEAVAFRDREICSVFGWRMPVDRLTNPRTVRAFPMQANGAEMLRLACCLLTEAGIKVLAPNHDAVLIEAPAAALSETLARAEALMADASAVVLDGFRLRTSVRVAVAPERWTEPRGEAAWGAIRSALDEPDLCAAAT